MGLDMYLHGERYIGAFDRTGGKFERKPYPCLTAETHDLGYWRKHPNLHGYIVQEFAEGEDNCQRIDLSREDITKIIDAITGKSLPDTTGFFFGKSEGTREERDEDVAIFRAALAWVDGEPKNDSGVSRSIYYQASW